MFVAGDHAKNDIAGEWKKCEKEASPSMYVSKTWTNTRRYKGIHQAHPFRMKHRMPGIMEKAAYAAGKDVE